MGTVHPLSAEANLPALTLVDDPNVVYTVHVYEPANLTQQGQNGGPIKLVRIEVTCEGAGHGSTVAEWHTAAKIADLLGDDTTPLGAFLRELLTCPVPEPVTVGVFHADAPDLRGMGADAFTPEHADALERRHRALVALLRQASEDLAAGRLQAAVDTVETIRDGLEKLPVGLQALR